MTLTKLGSLAVRVAHKNLLLQRLPGHGSKTLLAFQSNNATISSKNNDDDIDARDKPIEFLNSKAATWNAVHSRTGGDMDSRPWFQTYVISASISVFLLYFCVFREENDVDEKLTFNLSDHFPPEKRAFLEASQQAAQEYAQTEMAKINR